MKRLPFKFCQPTYNALGFKPTGPEQQAILEAEDRFPCISGGERAGKSMVSAAIMLAHMLALPKVKPENFFNEKNEIKWHNRSKLHLPHFLLVGGTYKEPRVEFAYIRDWLEDLDMLSSGPGHLVTPSEGAWKLATKHGVILQTWSLDDPKNVRALDLEGAIVCEAGYCPYDGVERIHGRVSARRGFIIFSGTMEMAEQWWTNQLLLGQRDNPQGFKSYVLPSWTNRVEFPDGYEDSEIQRLRHLYGEDKFLMRVAAEPRPPGDRVLKEAAQRHVRDVVFPEDAEIWVMGDPGYATAYAVLFVAIWEDKGKKRLHVIDEVYEQGLHTRDIINLCKKNYYWPGVEEGVLDIASKGHRDATDSSLEIWQRMTDIRWHNNFWYEDRLIERLNSSFSMDQLTISPRAKGLLGELGLGPPVFPEQHHWKYKVDKNGYIISEKPIDKWNHSCKALGYGALHILGQVEYQVANNHYNRLRGAKKGAASASTRR